MGIFLLEMASMWTLNWLFDIWRQQNSVLAKDQTCINFVEHMFQVFYTCIDILWTGTGCDIQFFIFFYFFSKVVPKLAWSISVQKPCFSLSKYTQLLTLCCHFRWKKHVFLDFCSTMWTKNLNATLIEK